jgi:FtsH-binding integral membrane protein
MGLIGVVIASIVGIWRSDAPVRDPFIGVIVFTGLAAYDAQRMKSMALAMPMGQTARMIVGAPHSPRLHQPVPLPAAVHRQSARSAVMSR